MADMCMFPGIDVDLGMCVTTVPSGFIWIAVPSAKPATSCFPLLLHDRQLTLVVKIRPLGPVLSCPELRSAIRSSPLVVITANNLADSATGFGTNPRRPVLFVEICNAASVFPLIKPSTWYTTNPPPSCGETTRVFSSAENATCDNIGTERLTSGRKGLMLPSDPPSALNAFLTLPVLAKTRESGPAAARYPFEEAMLSKEDVGDGRELVGQGDGNNRTLASPLIEEKPICWFVISLQCYPRIV